MDKGRERPARDVVVLLSPVDSRNLRPISTLLVLGLLLAGSTQQSTAQQELVYVINPSSDTISVVDPDVGERTTIQVGDGIRASGLEGGADGGVLYVPSIANGAVRLVDVRTSSIVGEVEVELVGGLRFTPYGEAAYVPLACGDAVLDTKTRRIAAHLSLETGFHVQAFDLQGRYAYAAEEDGRGLLVVRTEDHSVAGTVRLGAPLRALVPNPTQDFLYAVHADRISVIETNHNRVATGIHLNGGVDRVAVAPDGRLAYAARDDILSVVDLDTRRRVESFRLEAPIRDIVFGSSGTRAYIATADGITALDTASHRPRWSAATDLEPIAVVVAADESRVYVLHERAGQSDQTISIVTPDGAMLPTVQIDGSYGAFATLPESAALYLAGSRGLWRIDSEAADPRLLLVNSGPQHMVVSPDGRQLLVIEGGGEIDAIDTATHSVRQTIPARTTAEGRSSPVDITFTADGELVLVLFRRTTCCTPDVLAVFDATGLEQIGEITLQHDPDDNWGSASRLEVSPDGTLAYVAFSHLFIATVDLVGQRVVRSTMVGYEVSDLLTDIALSPDGSRIYAAVWESVADDDFPLIAAIDTDSNEIVDRMPLGGRTLGRIAVSPDGGALYALQGGYGYWPPDTFVTALDLATRSVTARIPLAVAGAYVEAGDSLYVSLPEADQIAVIDPDENVVDALIEAGRRPEALSIGGSPLPRGTNQIKLGESSDPSSVLREIQDLVVAVDRPNHAMSIIDGDSVRTVPLPRFPRNVALSPDGTVVYAAWVEPTSSGDPFTGFGAIDTASGEILRAIALRGLPNEVVLTPDGSLAYVSLSRCARTHCEGAVAIVDLDDHSFGTELVFESAPELMAAAPDGEVVLAAFSDAAQDNTVIAIGTVDSTVLDEWSIPGKPQALAVGADGKAYIATADPEYERVSIVSTLDLRQSSVIVASHRPLTSVGDLAVSPDGAILYWISQGACGSFAVSDTRDPTVPLGVPLPVGATAMALTADGERAYVSTGRSIVVLDPLELNVIGEVPVPFSPQSIEVFCRGPECPPIPTPIVRTPPRFVPTNTPTMIQTRSPTPTPGTPRVRLRVGSARAEAGERVEFDVNFLEEFAAGFVHTVQLDVSLDPHLSVPTWIDGEPDCESDMFPGRYGGRIAFRYLPEGCNAQDCRGLRMLVTTEEDGRLTRIGTPDRSTALLRCRLDVAPDSAPGTYPLAPSNVVVQSLDLMLPPVVSEGHVLVGDAPPPTTTPTPATPTITVPELGTAHVVVGSTVAAPGDEVTIEVELAQGFGVDSVRTVKHELWVDPAVTLLAEADGKPTCEPLANRVASAVFTSLPIGCAPAGDCRGVSVSLSSHAWQRIQATDDGFLQLNERRLLYGCRVRVAPDTPPGDYPIAISKLAITGSGIERTASFDGKVRVGDSSSPTPSPSATPSPSPIGGPETTPSIARTSTRTATATRRRNGSDGCQIEPPIGQRLPALMWLIILLRVRFSWRRRGEQRVDERVQQIAKVLGQLPDAATHAASTARRSSGTQT